MAFRGGVFCQQQARYAVLVCGSSVRCVLPVVTAVRVVLERLPREALVAVDECGVLFLFFFSNSVFRNGTCAWRAFADRFTSILAHGCPFLSLVCFFLSFIS